MPLRRIVVKYVHAAGDCIDNQPPSWGIANAFAGASLYLTHKANAPLQ
jgi:hypothetical protein